jgi:hypothetical protein
MSDVSTSTQSYNSMAGADIKAVFGGTVFGELQAISYAVTREKAPIYTMGSPDPRAYSRNKRGIAGSFVWVNFDRHSLLDHFNSIGELFLSDIDDIRAQWTQGANSDSSITDTFSTADVFGANPDGSNLRAGSSQEFRRESQIGTSITGDQEAANPWYSDQVPPFDIVLAANNEYGASAKMKLIGVEILNDGMGVSIDDTVIESQSTFVCRTLLPWTPVANSFVDPATGKIQPRSA